MNVLLLCMLRNREYICCTFTFYLNRKSFALCDITELYVYGVHFRRNTESMIIHNVNCHKYFCRNSSTQ